MTWRGYTVTFSQDGCALNSGEGGALDKATIFHVRTLPVPTINARSQDKGQTGEKSGPPLTRHPAFLR